MKIEIAENGMRNVFGSKTQYMLEVGRGVFTGTRKAIALQLSSWLQACAWWPTVRLITDGNEHTVIIKHAGETCLYRASGHGVVKLRHTCSAGDVDMDKDAQNAAFQLALDHRTFPEWLDEQHREQWEKFQRMYEAHRKGEGAYVG